MPQLDVNFLVVFVPYHLSCIWFQMSFLNNLLSELARANLIVPETSVGYVAHPRPQMAVFNAIREIKGLGDRLLRFHEEATLERSHGIEGVACQRCSSAWGMA